MSRIFKRSTYLSLSLINLSSSCNDFGCQHVVYHLLMTSLVVMWIGNVSDAHCITQVHSWRRRRLLEVMNLVFHLWIRCWHVNTARNHKKSGTRNVWMFFIDRNELLLLSNVNCEVRSNRLSGYRIEHSYVRSYFNPRLMSFRRYFGSGFFI